MAAAAAAPAAAAATTATATSSSPGSSNSSSSTFHQQLEPCLRKQTPPPRMDPRRRQAALSFLTNISLDGRPVLQDDEEENGAATLAATPPPLLRVASASSAACNSGGSGRTRYSPSAFQSPALLPQPQPGAYPGVYSSSSSARLMSPLGAAGQLQLQDDAEEEDEDEDAFASVQVPVGSAAFLGSSGTPSAGGARGRLNSFTQGILPVSFARAVPQSHCSFEQGQVGTSAFELQRSR